MPLVVGYYNLEIWIMNNPYPVKWRLAQFLELLWWKNYLSDKSESDYLNWKREYWKNFLNSISDVLPIHNYSNILDAGCGPAGIFTILANHQVTAIDPLLDKYQHGIAHFNPLNYPQVSFFSIPIEQLQAKNEYDIVFCLNAINHVADIQKAMYRLADSVKTGGYLVLSIDAHRYNFLKYLFRLFPGDVLHPHQHKLSGYLQMIGQYPFTILKTHCLKQSLIFNYWVIVAQKTGHSL